MRSPSDASVDPTDAPYMPIVDSAVEDALRPVAVGRKNYLHLGSDRRGLTAAVLMSLGRPQLRVRGAGDDSEIGETCGVVPLTTGHLAARDRPRPMPNPLPGKR